jgi:hypothetical protein
MILNGLANKVLLDVLSVPDVSNTLPIFIALAIVSGIALIVGVILLLYFLVFKNKKKK